MKQVRQKKTNIWYCLYVDSKKKKMAQMNQSIYKTEVEPQMQKSNLKLPGVKQVGINWKIGIDTYILLYLK